MKNLSYLPENARLLIIQNIRPTWRTWFVIGLITFLTGFVGELRAAPSEASLHRMTLSHHEFEGWSFKPRSGDRIAIDNRSEISHSIYVTYPDGTVVNLGVQLPGSTVNWTVPTAGEGEYLFQCWIHPIIRATLVVDTETSTVSKIPHIKQQ